MFESTEIVKYDFRVVTTQKEVEAKTYRNLNNR